MNAIRSLALAAAVSFGAALPAPAMPVANLATATAPIAMPADFLFSQQLLPVRVDGLSASTAAQDYFGFDTIITLGALALAGGAMAAFAAFAARKRAVEDAEFAEPAWRQSVFRAMQADLAEFTESFRRAA